MMADLQANPSASVVFVVSLYGEGGYLISSNIASLDLLQMPLPSTTDPLT